MGGEWEAMVDVTDLQSIHPHESAICIVNLYNSCVEKDGHIAILRDLVQRVAAKLAETEAELRETQSRLFLAIAPNTLSDDELLDFPL